MIPATTIRHAIDQSMPPGTILVTRGPETGIPKLWSELIVPPARTHAEAGQALARAGGEEPVAADAPAEVTKAWPALADAINDYIEGYELDSGEGVYTPSEAERFVMQDAFMGMLSDDDVRPLLRAALAAPVEVQGTKASDLLRDLDRLIGYDTHDGTLRMAQRTFLPQLRAALAGRPAPAAESEPVAYRIWHPSGRGFHLDTQPPSATRPDTGEPNEYHGGRVEPLYTRPAAPLSEGVIDKASANELRRHACDRIESLKLGILLDIDAAVAASTPSPATQPADEATDAGRIDALQRNRWGLVPEFEGDWHVVRYDMGLDDDVPSADEVAFAGGNTVRAAIDCAIDAALRPTPSNERW